jgi:phosphoribosylpyrophosphate synthetase
MEELMEINKKITKDLAEALQNLINEVLDIRGIKVDEYKPDAFKQARKALEMYNSVKDMTDKELQEFIIDDFIKTGGTMPH